MEYQKIINLLGNTPYQPTKFSIKNWIEINYEARETYKTNSQIKFKSSMLRPGLCNCTDVYILVKGTIIVANTGTTAAPNSRDKKVIFKKLRSIY